MKLSSIIPPTALALSFATTVKAEYSEHLQLTPLLPDSLLASFSFVANTSLEAFEQQNFRYFPRSLGQILQHANTKELHLRFSTGRWDAESWGARPWDGKREGGTGVELWAWVKAEVDEEADKQWKTLMNSLSGLFCASLNFIDSTRTTRPLMSFLPEGSLTSAIISNHTAPNMHLLHGTLPREVVCTENLTPFLKLLPSKGKAGISSLLDGHKLFDSNWQSMSIDVRQLPSIPGTPSRPATPPSIEITQTVDMVMDIRRAKRLRSNPIPRPLPSHHLKCDESKPYDSHDTCFPIEDREGEGWTLAEVFGTKIPGRCPSTSGSDICLNVDNDATVYLKGGHEEVKKDTGFQRCWKLSETEDFEFTIPAQGRKPYPLETPPLFVERTLTGYGQERGGVQTIIRNPTDKVVEFTLFESTPWWMKMYLHTLTTKLSFSLLPSNNPEADRKDLRKDVLYRPALDRERGTQLEMALSIPANSTLILSYDFEKAILRYTEYPPDANRGFDIPAAVIRVNSEGGGKEIRTTVLMVSLPTPDFSMPYNVIIFTSTVMALAFGFVFNLLVRRFVGVDEVQAMNIKALKANLIAKLKAKVSRFEKTAKVEGKIE